MRKALLIAGIVLVGFSSTSLRASAAVTPHTQADVQAAIVKAIGYLDTKQNPSGSFGASFPVAETALALVAYGVYDHGDVNSGILTAGEVTIVKNAVTYLLAQQNTSGTQLDGAWGAPYYTYSTGLALSALSFSKNAAGAAAIQTAITNGRKASMAMFQGPSHNPTEACSTTPSDPTSAYCGGYTYDFGVHSADESNTGFGLTGLKLTGGVPASLQALNLGWQRNIQVLVTNPWWTSQGRSDGGGAYYPGVNYAPFTSNANNTGSMLFGYADDGVPAADSGVVAGLKMGQDVLDVYEANKASRQGVYHTGVVEDGSCVIGAPGCDWQFDSDGGYHYSLWSLSKGLGEYVTPDLGDTSNWYAKVVDLLLGQQNVNGSWPVNGRDDATAIVATGFSVFSLGLAAAPPPPTTTFSAGSFHSNGTCSAVHLAWTNPNSPNYGGVEIRRRTDAYPTSPSDGTLVTNADAPADKFDDTGLAPNTTYFYAAFAYDVTKQVFGPAADAQASTIVCADTAGLVVPSVGVAHTWADIGGLSLLGLGVTGTLLAMSRRKAVRRGVRRVR